MSRVAKRIFDFTVACGLLLCAAPLLLVIAGLVRWNLGSPVLFKQMRPGFQGRSFCLIKFRTMLVSTLPDGSPRPDRARLTRFGRWLRSTSLDELPELWNVVRGEMSLVGPRPLLMQYLPLYSERQARRHEVRPGITGWAQVNGRNAISWEEKFEMDVWYVENQTLWLDIKILLFTARDVILRRDISADNHATMPYFQGAAHCDQNERKA